MYKSILTAVGIICLCMLLHGVSAQSISKPNNDSVWVEQELQPVIIYSKDHFEKRNSVNVLRRQLDVIQSPTLGETVSKIPGVQNSNYGPNSGAPVIRSLSGNRVKVMNNGLAVYDLSGISPNLNININQDNIISMEVYKDPATVLYGGKAIGGAINIKSNTIPEKLYPKLLNGMVAVEGSTNLGAKQSFAFNGNIKKLAWHIGGINTNKSNNIRIPGNAKPAFTYDPKVIGFDPILQTLTQVDVKSAHVLNVTLFPYINQFVLDHLNDPDYGLSEDDKYTFKETYYDPIKGDLPNPKNDKFVPGQDPDKDRYKDVVKSIDDYVKIKKGEIPNSHSTMQSVDGGLSYIGKKATVGFGYQGNYSYYGIPAFARLYQPAGHSHNNNSHQHSPEEYAYRAINVQSRSHNVMLQSNIRSELPWINSVNLKLQNQYATEYEFLDRTAVNRFNVRQISGRMEVVQRKWNFLSGVTGFEYDYREMKGEGLQKYLPNNLSREAGIFTLQNLQFDFVTIGIGYRNDQVQRRVLKDDTFKKSRGLAGGQHTARDFGLNHFSAVVKANILKNAYISTAYYYAERAPEVNELYAGNNHYAIVVEENGDDRLPKERASTIEIKGGLELKGLRFSTNLYHRKFKNYIYLGHTGVFRSGGLLVKEWRAADTDIDGMELEAAYNFNFQKAGNWELNGYFDLVKNKNVSPDTVRRHFDGDYMPNMPTSRVGLGLAGAVQKFTVNMSFDRYLQQKFLGKNIGTEFPMPAYNLLSARLAFQHSFKRYKYTCFVFGSNLLNVEARPQNALLKYLSPLPGRNIGIGLKVNLMP